MRQEVLYVILFAVGMLLGYVIGILGKGEGHRKPDGIITIQEEDGREKALWDFSGISEDELLKRKFLSVKVQNNLSKK